MRPLHLFSTQHFQLCPTQDLGIKACVGALENDLQKDGEDAPDKDKNVEDEDFE